MHPNQKHVIGWPHCRTSFGDKATSLQARADQPEWLRDSQGRWTEAYRNHPKDTWESQGQKNRVVGWMNRFPATPGWYLSMLKVRPPFSGWSFHKSTTWQGRSDL